MLHETALSSTTRPVDCPKPDFTDVWVNELSSTITLTQTGNSLTGEYTSLVSGTGQTVTGPLVGYVDGQIVSFTVNWPQPSITSWIGHLVTENGVDVIETLWHLATTLQDPNDPTELWNSVLAGADSFTRQLAPASAATAAGGAVDGGG